MQQDVLAIGDTTIDAFIRIKDASVHCDINHENCMLSMRFADKIPYEFVEEVPAVGNAANAAVACARVGLKASVRVHVGKDENGTKCIDAFKSERVDTSLIVSEQNNKTNYHYVLWYEDERTILIKHEHYNYSFPRLEEAPKWIYLSSVAEGTLPYHQEIAAYLNANPSVMLAFQPGTFQMKLGVEALKALYTRTEILFCNKEESQRILQTKEEDIKTLMQSIRALGPKISVITDGRKGAYLQSAEGSWYAPMYPDPAPPKERTGAGDATSSTTVAYVIKGLPPQEALLRGLINSANVVQEIGAQKGLLTAAQIDEWYAKRPADFKATPI
ncbi:carbohydrate kinase family protein [Candidatus Kaiserbacteria bacterium]|nr:carbohydrate kinase family protein [Candidatus Kaiserbacteria bacterium]